MLYVLAVIGGITYLFLLYKLLVYLLLTRNDYLAKESKDDREYREQYKVIVIQDLAALEGAKLIIQDGDPDYKLILERFDDMIFRHRTVLKEL